MCSRFLWFILLIFNVFSSFIAKADSFGENVVTISLANYSENSTETQVFDDTVSLSFNLTMTINVQNVSNNIEFFIIQVHSLSNLLLSSEQNFTKNLFVQGRNIGLVQIIETMSELEINNYDFFARNINTKDNATIYIAVIPYKSAPIPGGCNLEFETEIAPYQKLKYSNSIITVDAELASVKNSDCEDQLVKYSRFQMYLSESDFSDFYYFEGIQKMLTVDNIHKFGTQVSNPHVHFLRQLYNVYKGTGSVFVVVASYNDIKSAYIPIVSYGCDINNLNEDCNLLNSVFSKVLSNFLLIFGILIFFFAKKCLGFNALVDISYWTIFTISIACISFTFDDHYTIFWSVFFGCLFALTILLGWFFGTQISLMINSLFIFGFFLSSIIFYAALGGLEVMRNNLVFWGTFLAIISLCVITLSWCNKLTNILTSSFVGAYIFILSLDCFLGSNLKYIIITFIRRLLVHNYNEVIINPPFQWKDKILILIWIIFTIRVMWSQFKNQTFNRNTYQAIS